MKTLAAILAIIAASAMLAHARPAPAANDTSAGEAAIAKARVMENLRGAGAAAWMMRAKFTVDAGHGVQEGEYGLNWWSADRWQESMKVADFARGREGVKDGYWQSRIIDYQPEAIFDVDTALNPASLLQLSGDDKVIWKTVDKNHGDPLTCFQVGVKRATRTLCFDTPGRLVRANIDWGFSISGPVLIDYSDFQTLGDKQFPGKIAITRTKEETTAISVTKLVALAAPVPADASKGSNSEFWGWCDDMVPPKMDHQVQPKYPEAAKWNHEQGKVTLYARVEADGRVTHLKVLSGPSAALEQASVDAVTRWTYKPATCGGKPVPIETTIKVIYTLGG